MSSVTVCIASYKYGRLVSQAIDSVLSQSVPVDRVIVSDDGIGDCRWVPEVYPEVEFIEQPKRLGAVEHFNWLLNQVETEYVMMLGADNWLRPDAVEKVLAASRDGWDIVGFGAVMCGDKLTPKERKRFLNHGGHLEFGYLIRDWGNQLFGTSLYRAELGRRVGGYEYYPGLHKSVDAPANEDSALFLKMRQTPKAQVTILPDPLIFYRQHRGNFGG